MTFEMAHKLVTFGLVILGLLPLALSGEIPLPVVIVAYGAVFSAWFYQAPIERIEAHSRGWTVGTVAALIGLGVMGWVTDNWLLYAIYFSLVMVVTRLFQSRGSRDTYQLYGLTFVAVIAGAVVNPTLGFLGTFIGYVVLLVWGLILLHVQRDIEGLRAEQERHGEQVADLAWKARDLVTTRFLMGSSALALVVFAMSLMVFFFFPRLGMGFFFSQGRQSQSISGFSDRIELGHFGTIKDNMRVVMRVEFPDDRERAERTLRMRGISFDHYDGRVWSKSSTRSIELPREQLGVWQVLHATTKEWELDGTTVLQDVYLEPLQMEERMIFGTPRLQKLSIENPELDRLRRHPVRFYQGMAGDVSTRVPSDVALRYRAESRSPRRDAQLLNRATGALPSRIARTFLQLPAEMDVRVESLARAITSEATTPFERARAIERYLRAEYDYSTQGGHDREAPLEDFLFGRREGHCEYFASAMVILLRTLGVPARPANGFYGGVYNEYGRFYAVRQADAHAWVEVFFSGYGWLTFDPTPPSAVLVPAQGGVLGNLEEWYDSLKLQWYKWVVEYDLEKQMAFFRGIGDAMGDLKKIFPQPKGNPRSRQAWRDGAKEWASRTSTWVTILSPFVLAFLWHVGFFHLLGRLLMRLWPRRREVPDGAMEALYDQMMLTLERQGIGRGASETPSELAARLVAAEYGAADSVLRVTRGFEAARYAEREPSLGVLAELEGEVERIRLFT
jgi:hypothetical protein